MLPEDAVLEQLSDQDVSVYKHVLHNICRLVDFAIPGMKHYQEKYAREAFLPANNAAQLYFDRLTENETIIILQALGAFIPPSSTTSTSRATSPIAAMNLSSSSTSSTSSQYKENVPPYLLGTITEDNADDRTRKLKELVTTVAINAIKKRQTPTEITAHIINDVLAKFIENHITPNDNFNAEAMHQILADAMRQVLTTLFDFYHTLATLEEQRERLPLTKDGSIYHSLICRLITWIDALRTSFLNFESKILQEVLFCIDELNTMSSTLDQTLRNETKEQTQIRVNNRSEQLQRQIEMIREVHTLFLDNPMREIENIRIFVDILHSLQHPRPLSDLSTLKDLLNQLYQALLNPESKDLSKLIPAVQRKLEVEFDNLQLARHSTYCALFVTRTREILSRVADFHAQHNGYTRLSLKALIDMLEKTLKTIDKVIVHELCPLRQYQDFDLALRTAHYTYATNNRNALGTMAAKITEYADKALAQQLCDDNNFTATTIISEHTFVVTRLNNKIEQIILGDKQQGLKGCKDLIATLRVKLPRQHQREHHLLAYLWALIDQPNPYKNLDRDKINLVLRHLKMKAQIFAVTDELNEAYLQLCNRLERIHTEFQASPYATQVADYLNNAQICINDYCKWVIEHYRKTGAVPPSAMRHMPALHLAIIYSYLSEINVLAGNATMVNFGGEAKRNRDAIETAKAAAAADGIPSNKFYTSPQMQAILTGQSSDWINMSLDRIPPNLHKVILKTKLWLDFKAIYDQPTQNWEKIIEASSTTSTAASASTSNSLAKRFANKIRVTPYLQQFPSFLATQANAALKGLQSAVQRGGDQAPVIGNGGLPTAPTLAAVPATTDDNDNDDASSSSESSSEGLEPNYVLKPELVIEPRTLLTALVKIRDELHQLMPKTMDKLCPNDEHSAQRRFKKSL